MHRGLTEGAWSTGSKSFLVGVVAAVTVLHLNPVSGQRDETAAVTNSLESVYEAIRAGDATGAMRWIASDAVFIESGYVETRAEYEANHLPNDIDFESQIVGERGPLQINVEGSTAWVIPPRRTRAWSTDSR